MSRKKLRYSTATYRDSRYKNDSCDLEELAETYSSVGNVPERVGWLKAQEIALLARYFAILWKAEKNRQKEKKSLETYESAEKPDGR